MGSRRSGFTLIEVLTSLIVMTVIAGAAMMSVTSAKQTAKREAERVQNYIYRQMQRADRMHRNFTIEVFTDHLNVNWKDYDNIDSSFKPSDGCTFENHNTQDKTYNFAKKRFSGGTIRVHGADGVTYYVILAVANEGRVRISDTAP